MTSHLLRVGGFLLAGAAMTLMVAWTAAHQHGFGTYRVESSESQIDQWEIEHGAIVRSVGFTRIDYTYGDTLLSFWYRNEHQGRKPPPPHGTVARPSQVTCGWPLRCVSASVLPPTTLRAPTTLATTTWPQGTSPGLAPSRRKPIWSFMPEVDRTVANVRGGISLKDSPLSGKAAAVGNAFRLPKRVIPYSPAIIAFAINTIFYAAILWVLFAVPGSIRRKLRRQRGLCPACAYPVGPGMSETCSECGLRLDVKPERLRECMGCRPLQPLAKNQTGSHET